MDIIGVVSFILILISFYKGTEDPFSDLEFKEALKYLNEENEIRMQGNKHRPLIKFL